jgi:hypothetical protein
VEKIVTAIIAGVLVVLLVAFARLAVPNILCAREQTSSPKVEVSE